MSFAIIWMGLIVFVSTLLLGVIFLDHKELFPKTSQLLATIALIILCVMSFLLAGLSFVIK